MSKLINYSTNNIIRDATKKELSESKAAAKQDGGAGVIKVAISGERISCYVQN